MSAQHTPGSLDATSKLCERIKRDLQRLTDRIDELATKPGGRSALTHAERCEFDIIGSTVSTVEMRARAAIAKATGSA